MANKKISDLSAATLPLAGTEQMELQAASGESGRCTAQDVANLALKSLGSPVRALTIVSGVVNVDCALGDYFTLAHNATVTSLTFSNLPAPGVARTLFIRIRQDATGGRAFSLPGSLKAVGSSDTAVQLAANAYTELLLSTLDQGARWEYSMGKGAA